MSTGVSIEGSRLAAWRPRLDAFTAVRGSKLRIGAVIAAVIAVVALAVVVLVETTLFSIDRVDVTGAEHVSIDEVVAATGIVPGTPALAVDEGAVASAVARLPWVKEASVVTDFPSVVTVKVTERRAVALLQTGDKRWAYAAADGTVLAVVETPQQRLPVPLGVEAPNSAGARITGDDARVVGIAGLLPPSLQARVTQIHRDNNGMVRLGLDSGTIVELGDGAMLPDKLIAAATVLSHADPKTVAVVDVTSPRLPLVTKKQDRAAPAQAGTTTTTPSSAATESKTRPATKSGPKRAATPASVPAKQAATTRTRTNGTDA